MKREERNAAPPVGRFKNELNCLKSMYEYCTALTEEENLVWYELSGLKGLDPSKETGGTAPGNNRYWMLSNKLTRIYEEKSFTLAWISSVEKTLRIIGGIGKEENVKRRLDEIVAEYERNKCECSEKQMPFYLLIICVYEAKGYREVASRLGLKSTATVSKLIERAIEEGLRQERGF